MANLLNVIAKAGRGRAYAAQQIQLGDSFVYKHLGSMATVGRYKALVDLRQSKATKGLSMAEFSTRLQHLCLDVTLTEYRVEGCAYGWNISSFCLKYMELHQLVRNGCTLLVDFAVSFESFENRLLGLCVSVRSIMPVPLSPYPSPPVPFTPSANGSLLISSNLFTINEPSCKLKPIVMLLCSRSTLLINLLYENCDSLSVCNQVHRVSLSVGSLGKYLPFPPESIM
ncbi:hypothetical protein POM88_042066 [Heracleum sosnowskyi]|uniref:Uncharacterized protein n=1 Tax=Heracleum sosnowskyi TaxID=360622 RepID=A0AAD8HI90_9APIA|nr:hypothetical protein POM88_042066 [Heracleum sosnowskyi]